MKKNTKKYIYYCFSKDLQGEKPHVLVVTGTGQCDARHHTVRSDGTVRGAGVCGLHPAAEIAGCTGRFQGARTRSDAHRSGQMCATPPASARVSSNANWPWINCFVCYLDK